ncbi:hypothetical protein HYT57_00300 [Candidatus Woesearchaeota archaeon]|nr:hypothetical protein [Candidatus Woesearchaeota archaeon]
MDKGGANKDVGINITTAVDSLVLLVNSKKRIPMEEASKILGLPDNIINEWATFLDEENVIKIEYQLTTPFLVETEDTKKVLEEKVNIDIEKDLISRKISVMISAIDKINVSSSLVLKNEEDLKKIVLNKDLGKNDSLYAQKFYLKIRLNELLGLLKNQKSVDIFKINERLAILEKKKKVFEDNFKKER